MKKSVVIRLIIGIFILLFLIYKIDAAKVYETVKMTSPQALIIFLLLPFLMLFGTSINLFILLKSLKEKVSFSEIVKHNFLSRSVGFYFPGKLGEFSLVYLLRKQVSYGNGTLVVIMDKMITFIVLAIISVLGFFIFFEQGQALRLMLFLIIIFTLFFMSLASDKIRGLVKKYLLRSYAPLFKGFSKNMFYLLKKRKDVILLNLIITFLLWFVLGALIKVIFVLFGHNLALSEVFIIHSIGVLSSAIPISISGIGVRESIAVFLFSRLNVQPEITLGVYLLFLFFSYLIASVIIIINNKKIANIKLKK